MAKQGVNEVRLIGNIGGDPELRYFPDGSGVCNVTIATSESWNDKQTGEKKEKTEWHRLVFRDRGNYKMAQYASEMQKGQKIWIAGTLRTRNYEQNGVKHYVTEVHVQEFQHMQPRDQGGYAAPGGQQGTTSAPPQRAAAPQANAPAPTDRHGNARTTQPQAQPEGGAAGMKQAQTSTGADFGDFDDDIPF